MLLATLVHIIRGSVVGSGRFLPKAWFVSRSWVPDCLQMASGCSICHCANTSDRCRRSESTYIGSERGKLESAEAAQGWLGTGSRQASNHACSARDWKAVLHQAASKVWIGPCGAAQSWRQRLFETKWACKRSGLGWFQCTHSLCAGTMQLQQHGSRCCRMGLWLGLVWFRRARGNQTLLTNWKMYLYRRLNRQGPKQTRNLQQCKGVNWQPSSRVTNLSTAIETVIS